MILDLIGQLPGYLTMNFVPGTGSGPVAFALFQDNAHAQEALNALQGRTICEAPVLAQVGAASPPHTTTSTHTRPTAASATIAHTHAFTHPRVNPCAECCVPRREQIARRSLARESGQSGGGGGGGGGAAGGQYQQGAEAASAYAADSAMDAPKRLPRVDSGGQARR